MPEDRRIDYQRDLTPEGYELAIPLIARMVVLERDWVMSGDDAIYNEWRGTVGALQLIVDEHRVDGERLMS